MKVSVFRASVAIAIAMLTSAVLAQPKPATSTTLPARFTAYAVSTGGPRTSGVATQVEIVVNRWSTAAESQRLAKILTDKGGDATLEVLREMEPVGRITVPGNLGYDLHYALEVPLDDGGRRIFLATDRPISYWEAVNQPRTVTYPFTFIELKMNGQGEGEGKLALATRLESSGDGRHLQLVGYAAQPIQLNEVTLER